MKSEGNAAPAGLEPKIRARLRSCLPPAKISAKPVPQAFSPVAASSQFPDGTQGRSQNQPSSGFGFSSGLGTRRRRERVAICSLRVPTRRCPGLELQQSLFLHICMATEPGGISTPHSSRASRCASSSRLPRLTTPYPSARTAPVQFQQASGPPLRSTFAQKHSTSSSAYLSI